MNQNEELAGFDDSFNAVPCKIGAVTSIERRQLLLDVTTRDAEGRVGQAAERGLNSL